MGKINTTLIKKVRKEMGLTQTELSTKADLAPNVVVNIELGRGNPHISSLQKLAKALNLKLSDLFIG